MFGSFTGSSKKQRKVDLSGGQRRENPFSGTSWAPGSHSGPSKSVEDANKQREERQRQRDRLRATLNVQRIWRGQQTRNSLRQARRQALDELYSGDSMLEPEERLLQAVPLVLASFQASRPADVARLNVVVGDLLQTNFHCFQSQAIHQTRLINLVRILLASLESFKASHSDAHTETFLTAINEILQRWPESAERNLASLYKALAKQVERTDIPGSVLEVVLKVAVALLHETQAPDALRQAAYRAFAWNFLTQGGLSQFEGNTQAFAAHIDLDMLSESLLDVPDLSTQDESARIWLLAHFIGIQRAQTGESLHLLYLKALYTHLAALSTRVRDGIKAHSAAATNQKDEAALASFLLPPYVFSQLRSLPDAVEIEKLLDKFTLNQNELSAADSHDASFLAGYILTLVHCFPESGDEIRMRLYLADISTAHGRIPAVKFFWSALSCTTIFSVVLTDQEAARDLLGQLRPGNSTNSIGGSMLEKEWRTTLLFLELYIFVLRLTDDEDFFNGLYPPLGERKTVSRIGASAFSLEETTRLSLFLRNLGFTLHWYGPDLFKGGVSRPAYRIDDFLTGSTLRSRLESQKDSSGSVAIGIDFSAFRDLVTTAVHMLYERDSRRRFLPQDHWLMKQKFKDLDEFLQAVIVDFEQQQQGGEDDDEEEEVDDDQAMDLDEPPRFSTYSSHLQSLHARLELQKRHKKASEERNRKAASPRLNILRNMPFIIPFDVRVQIFRQFVYLDMGNRREGYVDPDQWRLAIMNRHRGNNPFEPNSHGRDVLGRHHGEIKRGQLFSDAMKAFYELGVGLKEPIQITFIDKFGAPEAGIDGGGVTKEFLTSVTNEAFGDEEGLFVTNKKNAYFPNPCAVDQLKESLREAGTPEGTQLWHDNISKLLQQYEFLGRIIGKCMYEGILIDIVFAGFFLLKWASEVDSSFRTNINDLRELDEELYQGMLRLKNFDGDVKDLGLDFTIDDQVSAPGRPLKTITRDLLPDGENIAVDNKNRPLYISYVARHRLVNQPGPQTRAFLRGLTTIIDPAWLRMFNQNELQWLVGGDSSEIDVEDLRAHTDYSGPYMIGDDGEEHPTIKLFWQVMHGLEDSERREVLKYVTSTPRAPLLGFSQLRPRFTIRFGGADQERLPSASTCVNLLKLPAYESAAVLKNKLLYAVQAGAGFDLS
ncbi:hypothetical protein GQ53DRAFT_786064 [Thozetella sp. PMI_491]|nr:hypothetical protein GQ53DRAFT_786064 [Thozetella sp. PMI_491]